jgi:hypothetical protein
VQTALHGKNWCEASQFTDGVVLSVILIRLLWKTLVL